MPKPPTESQVVAIYHETVDALYGYASRRCGGERSLAEDVTQEAWLRAVREWQRTGLPDNPLAWLTTVVRNLILNQMRRRESLPIDDVPPHVILDAVERDAVTDSSEVALVLNRALARLPQNEARLLDEFHFQRCRVSQLAELYGISERAIEGRLRRARERLRQELELILPKAEGGMI
jgi:RNA polymerase sigma-70 factor (ECF subfamily)